MHSRTSPALLDVVSMLRLFVVVLFSKCIDTEQILERQVLRTRFLGSILIFLTRSQMRESSLGRLGEKHECYLCAI